MYKDASICVTTQSEQWFVCVYFTLIFSLQGLSPDTLQEVNVPVVGNNQCQCDYRDKYTITENMICAGLREGGRDSCQVCLFFFLQCVGICIWSIIVSICWYTRSMCPLCFPSKQLLALAIMSGRNITLENNAVICPFLITKFEID